MKFSVNKTVLTLVLILCLEVLKAQQPQFTWANKFGGTGGLPYTSETSLGYDDNGNVYSAGRFQGTFDFDPGVGVYNLSSYAPAIFISKLDAGGNFVWVKMINSSPIGASIICMAIDKSGEIYISGTFTHQVDFDPGPGVYNLEAPLSMGMFILKLDRSGSFVWAKQISGYGDTYHNKLALDNFGNICIGGTFSGTIDFDPGVNTYNLTSSTSHQFFISKLDTSGNFKWVKTLGSDECMSIITDTYGNIYATGYFYGTVDFDPNAGVFNLTSNGNLDIFISKYDPSGNFLWAKNMGGSFNDGAYSIALDSRGGVYTTGFFSGTVDFDPNSGIYNLTSSGGAVQIFISKLDTAGNFIWARSFGGSAAVVGRIIEIDKFDGIYISGSFAGIIDFDPGAGIYNMTSIYSSDIFIAKLNNMGNFEWARQIQGTSMYSSLTSLVIDSFNLYGLGIFTGSIDFDPSDTVIYKIPNTGTSVFLLKWNICNSFSNITRVACDSFVLNNQTYKTTGKHIQNLKNFKGCDSIITLNLTITKTPKAKFILQSQAGCQYVEYTFTDSSFADTAGASGFTYTWDFGDGTNATINSKTRIPNFKHIYNKGGAYTVRLNFNNGFCNDSFSILNSVFILPAPKPGFVMNSHTGCTPFILNIKDTLTTDIVLKEYDFGNGFVALKNNKVLDTTIQFNTRGTHIIQQRVTGTTGCVTKFIDTLYITDGLSKADTVNVLFTTVVDSNTTFTQWNTLPNAVSYTINNKNTIDTFFTDNNVQPFISSLHYFVSAIDSCGNKTDVSPVAQTIYLTAENQNFDEFALLEYTPYETWKQGVMEYQIEYYNNISQSWKMLNTNPGSVLTAKTAVLPDSSNAKVTKSQICYRIKAIEQNVNVGATFTESISNVACVSVYPVVFLPNAFSPNGDGLNDYYKPICAGLNIYTFEIYDRWGQMVYSDTPESKGWDGTFRGEKLPLGAYVYRLSATSFLKSPNTNDSRFVERKGTLFLVR